MAIALLRFNISPPRRPRYIPLHRFYAFHKNRCMRLQQFLFGQTYTIVYNRCGQILYNYAPFHAIIVCIIKIYATNWNANKSSRVIAQMALTVSGINRVSNISQNARDICFGQSRHWIIMEYRRISFLQKQHFVQFIRCHYACLFRFFVALFIITSVYNLLCTRRQAF